MLITASEERKKGMTALYIDGEYAVSVDTVTLASSGFHTGSDITDDELHELLRASKISRAKEKALYLIEYRSRTRKELRDKLLPLFGEEAAEAAIERLEQLGLIDDEGFARDIVRSIQDARRKLGCAITDRISMKLTGDVPASWVDYICGETLSDNRDFADADTSYEVEYEDGRKVTVALKK